MNCNLANICGGVLPPISGELEVTFPAKYMSPLVWLVLALNFSRLMIAVQWTRWGSDNKAYRCVVSHGNPEKMFPSNVLISLEAEKNPLSLIENPHKSPFRKFFYDHSKVELFSFLCNNFYKKILSITRQRKDATTVAQLTLILNARVSYHKCHTHNKLDAFWYRFTK